MLEDEEGGGAEEVRLALEPEGLTSPARFFGFTPTRSAISSKASRNLFENGRTGTDSCGLLLLGSATNRKNKRNKSQKH
jgi:hypothetical protein